MAYIQNFNKQKTPGELQQEAAIKAGTAAPTTNTGELVTSGATDSKVSKAPTASASGRFVNLQNYLNTNKQGAVDLAGAVSGNISDKTAAAQTALNEGSNKFSTDVTGSTNQYNQDLVSKTIANPNAIINSAEGADVQKMLSGAYLGPTLGSTTSFDTAKANTDTAVEGGKLLKSSAGQTTLLKEISKENPYSKGGYSLNQLLMQNTDPARAQLETASKSTEPLTAAYQAGIDAAQAKVDAARQANINTANTTRQEFFRNTKEQEAAWNNKVQAERTQAMANRDALMANLSAYSTSGDTAANLSTGAKAMTGRARTEISDIDLMNLGISRAQMNEIQAKNDQIASMGGKRIDLSTWMTPKPIGQVINPETIAAQDEIIRYNALNNLIGNAPSLVLDPTKADPNANKNLSYFDPTQAYENISKQVDNALAREQSRKQNEETLRAQRAQHEETLRAMKAQNEAQIKAQKRSSRNSMIGTIVGIAAVFAFSDEKLKKDKTELSSEDINDILNQLTINKNGETK